MTEKHNFLIYTWLVIGILLFNGTFYIAWASTEEYRSNVENTGHFQTPEINTNLI